MVRRTTSNEEVESSSPVRVDFFFRSFCRLMAGDRVLEADVRVNARRIVVHFGLEVHGLADHHHDSGNLSELDLYRLYGDFE